MASPIVRWIGGKSALLKELKKHDPPVFERYFEPFAGGLAQFFRLEVAGRLAKGSTLKAVVNDSIAPLANVYRMVRDYADDIIEALIEHQQLHEEQHYYTERSKPYTHGSTSVMIEHAARFLYLNKTSFNGVYRVNKKGEYNVPWDPGKKPASILDAANLRAASAALKVAKVMNGDYAAALRDAERSDYAYFDPPYVPVKTDSFVDYTAKGFDLGEQERLAKEIERLVAAGVHVVASNSDTEWIRHRYADLEQHVVLCPRNVNSDGAGRGKVQEIVIVGRGSTRDANAERRENVMTENPETHTEGAPKTSEQAAAEKTAEAATKAGEKKNKRRRTVVDVAPSDGAAIRPAGALKEPPIARLKTNMKGRRIEVMLSDRTAIIGKTKSWKSSIEDGVRFAVLGLHDIGRQGHALARLGETGTGLYAVVDGAIGSSGYGVTVNTNGQASAPNRSQLSGAMASIKDPLVLFPSSSMEGLIAGDKKTREAVARRFVQLDTLPTPNVVGTDAAKYLSTWATFAASAASTLKGKAKNAPEPAPVIVLTELPGLFRSSRIESNKKAASESTTAESLDVQIKSLVKAEEIKLQYQTIKATGDAYLASEQIREGLRKTQAAIAATEKEAELFIDAGPAFDKDVADLQLKLDREQERIRGIAAELKAKNDDHQAQVTRINRAPVLFELLRSALAEREADLKAEYGRAPDPAVEVYIPTEWIFPGAKGEIPARYALKELAAITETRRAEVKALETERGRLQQAVASSQIEANRILRLKDSLTSTRENRRLVLKSAVAQLDTQAENYQAALADVPDTLPADYQIACDRLADLDAADKLRIEHAKVIERARLNAAEAQLYGVLEDAATALLIEALRGPLQEINAKVQGYLPATTQVRLEMDDVHCEWVGVDATGAVHPIDALSGSERSMLKTAIALAWTEGAPFRILLLDDAEIGPFHCDPTALKAYLQKLDALKTEGKIDQVIVSGLLKGDVPKGWSIIDMDQQKEA